MRRFIAGAISTAMFAWGAVALPCGEGFGVGLTIAPTQKIVVSYQAGVETYFFSPHFCGATANFGLILPVPNALSSTPVLGSTNTISELEDLTAPTILKQDICLRGYGDAGSSIDSGTDAASPDASTIRIIDKGQVGIFDWTLLHADTTASFTSWLDANHYPYNSGATSAFDYYVGLSWYFVAFKVTADSHDPPDGGVLCGDLGPIQLAFPAASPVVPARIVGAPRGDGGPGPVPVPDGGEGLPQSWRVFTIDDHQTSLAATPATLRFSGALSASDIATHQAVAQLGVAGNRITEFEVDFWPWLLQSDLVFQPAPADTDFRRTEYQYQYVSCPNDAGPPEADSSVIEGGPGDAIVPFVDAGPDVDATVADAGPPADASPEGASSSDATLADATIADATVGDASVADASAADSSPVETSSRDATADAAGSYGVAGGAGGCSCRNAPGEPASAWAFVLGALPVVMVLRARRRGARAR